MPRSSSGRATPERWRSCTGRTCGRLLLLLLVVLFLFSWVRLYH